MKLPMQSTAQVLLLLAALFLTKDVFAQSVGISNVAITPDASSILEIRSTSKGLLIPRLTTAERDAITSPATGLMIFNSTTNKFNFYNSTAWADISAGPTVVNSINGTANRISIAGTSEDPVIDIAAAYTGQNTITTLGTVGTGTWNGALINPVYGGTGVNNGTKTITLGGNLTLGGAFATTLNATAATTITLPTTGTLSTLAGVETLTNKTLPSPVITSPTGLVKADVGLGNVDNTSDVNKPISNATQTALNLKINNTEKGANNGVASLDAGGKIPISQMASGPQLYKGTWNATTNTPALSDGTGTSGDTYRVVVGGTLNLGSGNITFNTNDDAIHNGSIWQRNPATYAVTSVNGQSGTVVLGSDQVTEGTTNKYYTDARAALKINTADKGVNNGVATLDASGKIPVTQLPVGSQTYKGTWDAAANNPTIADNTGSNGWTYRVTTAGTQNLGSGNISFSVGDDVIHNGTIWERSPSAASVTSVNTQTGNVVLNTDNINEGSTNQYFTNTRVRAAISANAPLDFNSGSGVISMPQATSSVNGFLNAADWVTFNQKQAAFSNSAGLASVLSDETGSGLAVFSTTPTLVTPVLGVASSTSETITGTGGAGYLELQSQSAAPSIGPTNSIRIFSNGGSLSWKRTDGYTRNFNSTLTADRTYTLPDANGTVAVSASGNIALSAAGNISFTGTLPIANGGTNSSTALNNNRIMVSGAGSIQEAAALTNGQLLIGSTSLAPVAANLTAGNGIVITNAPGSITIANEPTITQVTSATFTTTTSLTDELLAGMTITPGAGDYLVFFTGSLSNTNDRKQGTVSMYKNGVKIAGSEIQTNGPKENYIPVAITQYVTGLAAGQAIDIRWNVLANTGTFYARTLIVQKVK